MTEGKRLGRRCGGGRVTELSEGVRDLGVEG